MLLSRRTFDTDTLSILTFVGALFLAPIFVFAATSCGNGTSNTSGGGSTGGSSDSGCCLGAGSGGGGITLPTGGGGGGGTSSPPPPPPRACALTISPRVIERGTPNVTVSWSPADTTSVTISELIEVVSGSWSWDRYDWIATVNSATSRYTFNTASLPNDTHTLRASYSQSGTSYQCEQDFTIVERITECNDGVDNGDSEDSLSDAADPGCHSDGDPSNGSSYNQNDDDESNPLPDIQTTLSTGGSTHRPGVPITLNGTFRNTERVAILSLSENVVAWRRIGASCSSSCVTINGNSYRVAESASTRYGASGTASSTRRLTPSITPTTLGTYEVCAAGDRRNAITEQDETDNIVCETFEVLEMPPIVNLDIRKDERRPRSWGSSVTIAPGDQAVLRVRVTDADSCSAVLDATAQNGFSVPSRTVSGGIGYYNGSNISVQEPALGPRSFTLRCSNDAGVTTDTADLTVSDGTIIIPPPTLTATPERVRRDSTVTIEWDTAGNTNCSITGNDETIPVTAQTGSQESAPIVGKTVYTMACDGVSVNTEIEVLAGYVEF